MVTLDIDKLPISPFITDYTLPNPGKTTLVGHVAALTGRTIHNQGLLKVQLGDQTDAKVLLGTYHSTDIPGEFVWTAGVLTQVKDLCYLISLRFHCVT